MADATIQTGEKLQLNFDVENRGTRRGSQTVELLLDDTVVDEGAVVLDSAETGQLVLETDAFSDDDDGQVFVVETVIGTRTEATFEVEVAAIPDDGLTHHYDATELDLDDGDPVAEWVDESGEGNDLDSGPGATFSEDEINGLPAVQFDGTDDYLNGPISQDEPYTVAIAMRLDSGGSGDRNVIAGFNDSDQVQIEWFEGDWRLAGDITGSSNDNITILTAVLDSSDAILREDGEETVSGSTRELDANALYLGRRPDDSSRFLDGVIGEFLLYNERKSENEMEEIEQYIADKWGVSI